jgi:spore maturation protein CgeB
LRILVVHPGPHFSVADVYEGWIEALEGLGQRVGRYNLGDRLTAYDVALAETGRLGPDGEVEVRKLYTHAQAIQLASNGILSAAYQFAPEVLLVVSCMFVDPGLLDIVRSRGTRVVLLHTESPYQDDEQLERAGHSDISLLNDPTNLERFRAVGPAHYVPHAYRPSVHHPGPPSPGMASEFCFVGTGFESRIRFLTAMDLDGLDVLLAGHWKQLEATSPLRKWLAHDIDECLDNDQTAQVYRSAQASLNLYRREANDEGLAEGWAMSPREVEMAACGLWFARDPRPEGDELLPLPTFTTPEEAGELVRWFLAHDGPRQAMADAAREAVAERTFTHNAKRLLELLDR